VISLFAVLRGSQNPLVCLINHRSATTKHVSAVKRCIWVTYYGLTNKCSVIELVCLNSDIVQNADKSQNVLQMGTVFGDAATEGRSKRVI